MCPQVVPSIETTAPELGDVKVFEVLDLPAAVLNLYIFSWHHPQILTALINSLKQVDHGQAVTQLSKAVFDAASNAQYAASPSGVIRFQVRPPPSQEVSMEMFSRVQASLLW